VAVLTPPRHYWIGTRGLDRQNRRAPDPSRGARWRRGLVCRRGRSAISKVRVSTPPIEGEANEALERLLAKVLKVAKSSVRLVSGTTARLKQVEITELEQEDALARLGFAPS